MTGALSVLLAVVNVIPQPKEMTVSSGVYMAPADVFDTALNDWTHDATLPAEGYTMTVTPDGLRITAADAAGAYYAVQTLRQLSPTNTQGLTLREIADLRRLVSRDSSEPPQLSARSRGVLQRIRGTYTAKWPVPCVTVRDWPDYRWRALMLDEGRHFFGKSAVKDLLDRMAEYKLNVFHWHLTEDQGWRLDIPGMPELVKYGASRPSTAAYRTGPSYPDGFEGAERYYEDGERYGPYYYTTNDVAEILAYAKSRHIKVMPEIEFPGHARALLAAHPEFSCVGESLPRVPRTVWGVEKEVVCGGNLDFYAYMERLLDEVCALFPDSDIIHIGGDECFCERWKSCSKCQGLMKKEGLRNERALQSRMTIHFADYLKSKGRRIMGWDGLLTGEPLDPSSTLVHYRKPRPGARAKTAGEAAALGHDVVVIRTQNCYFNYAQGLSDDPHFYHAWHGNVLISDVYACDPLQGVAKKDQSRILGAEGLLWSEYVKDRGDLEWKLWPRSCALAEALWSGRSKPGFEDFRRRMRAQVSRLRREGLNCASAECVVAAPVAESVTASEKIVLSNACGRVVVDTLGARVTSYVPAGEDEVLFMPRAALPPPEFNHGGIPICWPWFGREGAPGSFMHGFVRLMRWRVVSRTDGERSSRLVLGLSSGPESGACFAYDFELLYEIVLSDSLRVDLTMWNRGRERFELTTGLHPYFAVGALGKTSVRLPTGEIACVPGIDGARPFAESRSEILDRVGGRTISVDMRGNRNLVLWTFAEPVLGLTPEEGKRYVCLEPTVYPRMNGIWLEPGESHSLGMTVSVSRF